MVLRACRRHNHGSYTHADDFPDEHERCSYRIFVCPHLFASDDSDKRDCCYGGGCSCVFPREERTKKETSRYKENIADIPALAAALRCGGILADHIVYMGFADGTAASSSRTSSRIASDAYELEKLNIEDVRQDILDASNENLLRLTKQITAEIERAYLPNSDLLKSLAEKYDVAEINMIDEAGIIIASTEPEFMYYNMRGGEQSAAFLVLLDGQTTEFVQSYMPTSSNPNILRKYAGIALDGGGFVQVAYDAERFQKDIDDKVVGATRNRRVGEDGCIIIADENGNIVSDRHGGEGRDLGATGINLDKEKISENQIFETEVYGENAYCVYVVSEGYYIIATMPKAEALFSRDISVYVTVFMEFVVFGVLFIFVYFLIKKLVVDNMEKVNRSLSEITGGNLDVVVDVRSNEEFASLSDDINSTVLTLKRYIAEAAARIDRELEFAKAIQHSAIPSVFISIRALPYICV